MTDFGDAVQEMREGGKVRRKGWEGQWLELRNSVIMMNSDDAQPYGWLGKAADEPKSIRDDEVADDLMSDDWEAVD